MDGFGWYNNVGSFEVTVTAERADVSSSLFSVDSSISYADWPCLPDRPQCTPARALVRVVRPGVYHVILPAQLEWGAAVPAPKGATVTVKGAVGTVCLNYQSQDRSTCHGPDDAGPPAGSGFLVPDRPAGALVSRTGRGQTRFSVNDRAGAAFKSHAGYFEFEAHIQ
jgi:hypothetical protein